MIVKTDTHDQMDLPTGAPTGKLSHWERVPDLYHTYDPMVKTISFLMEKGLTSMMLLLDFLSQRIGPL